MSDIPEDVLDTARAILATIAQKLTDPEVPSLAKLEPPEREVLRDAIFQSLDFAYFRGILGTTRQEVGPRSRQSRSNKARANNLRKRATPLHLLTDEGAYHAQLHKR